MSDSYVLKMENINISFNGIPALRDACFFLKPGEVHALVGANGAGKSTLMKILTGVYRKESGSIAIDDKPVEIQSTEDAQKKGIAMIFQEFSLVPTMTVAQNVFLKRENRVLGNLFINDRSTVISTRKILDELGVDIDPTAVVDTLSVGYMQAVEIAKALSKNVTRILVMDEPTASLSETETLALFKVIRDLKRNGIGIVYISHRMQEIFKICDRVTVIRDGRSVLTENCSNLTINKLVESMVGTETERSFEWVDRDFSKSGKPLLEVKDLMPTPLMKPISFDIHPGEIVGLAGLMGSGRTEIVECIFGIRKPIQGNAYLDGNRITSVKSAVREGIAFLPENRRKEGLVLDHSIRSNIMLTNLSFFRKFGFMDDSKGRKVTAEYIDKLKIKTNNSEKVVRLLSGGNQQKVVFSKWLAKNPRLFILDEPTIGVDIVAKMEIVEIIRSIADQGVAVLVISSELAELLAVSDRLIVIHNGKINGELSRKEISSEEVLHNAIQGI